MKKVKILFGLAVVAAFCAVIMLGSCSSYDEPEQGDDTLKSYLENADKAVVYQLHEVKYFIADKDESGQPAGEWSPTSIYGLSSWPGLIISAGESSWTPMDMSDSAYPLKPVAVPWFTYCKETSYDKDIYIPCPIVYSTDNSCVTINGMEMEINDVSADSLVVSHILDSDSELLKLERKYSIRKLEKSDLENVTFYETERDAMLAMVRREREYFGDIYDSSVYDEDSETALILDLKLLEEDIMNGELDHEISRYILSSK